MKHSIFISSIIVILLLFISILESKVILVPSFGIGNNHGGLGCKTLLAYDDDLETGWVIGLGSNGGMFAYSIGFQLSIDTYYISVNRGNVGTHKVSEGGVETSSEVIEGFFGEIGNVFYFKSSNFFIDAALGYAKSEKFKFGDDDDYSFSGLAFDIGIGYNFW